MNVKLGIDTGGSYTDAVLIGADTQKILRCAKSPTTKEDLTIGIGDVIEKLDMRDTETVTQVCLSTTLATNAIVEGTRSAVGLVTIGACVKDGYPAACSLHLKGKINVAGCEIEPLSEEDAARGLKSMKGVVEAVAVSGYASVRNPIHELRIKRLADQILGVPVICAHQLTSTLGYYERTVTAVLNARLIPVIGELLTAAKKVLVRKGIHGRILMVKGDGHVMVDSFAREKPVETILSGPAASMIGGRHLSGLDRGFIVDMGGTTTDIAFIENGILPVAENGAKVGGWETKVKAVSVNTVGLGGDSYLRQSQTGKIEFGPDRVIPLCLAAEQYPYLAGELADYGTRSLLRTSDKGDLLNAGFQVTDCVTSGRIDPVKICDLSKEEQEIVQLLEEGPHSVSYLCDKTGRMPGSLKLERLLQGEIVKKISMTPTDLLHAAGEYCCWNRDASIQGVRLLSASVGKAQEQFLREAADHFVYLISLALVRSAYRTEGAADDLLSGQGAALLLNTALSKNHSRMVDLKLKFKAPVIGVGAPAGAWLTKVAQAVECEVIVPEYGAVANAVGAAIGDIKEIVEALIRYNPHTNKYIAHSPGVREIFASLAEARSFIRQELTEYGLTLAAQMNLLHYDMTMMEYDCHTGPEAGKKTGFVESHINLVLSAISDGALCIAGN